MLVVKIVLEGTYDRHWSYCNKIEMHAGKLFNQ